MWECGNGNGNSWRRHEESFRKFTRCDMELTKEGSNMASNLSDMSISNN